MTKLFAWCDSPTAPTGFGRSANHVLHALHNTGRYDITQLAVNYDRSTESRVPWRIHQPTGWSTGDPYGLNDLPALFADTQYDMLWTTFDPEVPWRYEVGGNKGVDALSFFAAQRHRNPGFRMVGWFPVDGGPLSDYELAVLGQSPAFDAPVTMSPHVYQLMRWTMELRKRIPQGQHFSVDAARKRLGCIPHGVDLSQYRIASPEEKAAAKVRLGFKPDQLVIIQVERNQQRKQNYLALSVLEKLRAMRKGAAPEVVLYQHMLPDEENHGCRLGFNLPDIAWRYGLEPGVDVRWPNGFVPDEEMVRTVYAAADAFVSCSTGEGFQYPAWEALACGIPVVAPNADARKAWFGDHHAPNTFLYDARPDSILMRGGYGRRMALPDTSAAAKVLNKMLSGRRAYRPTPEAGRAWVGRTASVEDVQQQWVELMDAQVEELAKERAQHRVAMRGQEVDYRVDMLENPGLGDVVAAVPALRALRKRGTVALVIPRAHLDLCKLLDAADLYVPRAATELLSDVVARQSLSLTELYHPTRCAAWLDPREPRQNVIARQLGVEAVELEPLRVELPPTLLKAARDKFMDTFGVDPTNCVGLAFQSGSPDRALPDNVLPQMLPVLRALEATPVLLGTRAMNVRFIQVADLTGQTDLVFLLGLIAQLAAVVTADSAVAHFAAVLGTPAVVAFTTVSPESRLSYYTGKVVAVTPEDDKYPAGVVHPYGVGYFTKTLTAGRLGAALQKALGVELSPPEDIVRVTLPQEVTK